MTVAAAEVKACCASAYASPAARYLLGDSFHSGGLALTGRLVRRLAVGPDSLVADVACGPGSSARLAARIGGCAVVGLDISPALAATAAAAPPGARVHFVAAAAEALPLDDGSVDGVLCECALCLFPDPARAVREMARVLRVGARLALADVTAAPDRLPPELRTREAHLACLGGARPLEEIVRLVRSAGLAVQSAERHDDAAHALLDRVEARLRLARLVGLGALADGLGTARTIVDAARRALVEGTLGYAVVIARR